jgi:ERCC4-type nuclease
MKVIFDVRENDLYSRCISMENTTNIQYSKEVLILGDILLKTNDDKEVLLIERKSFSDLLASIKDGRYEEQSYRLLNSSGFIPHSIIYLLEGMFSKLRTPIEKKIIHSSMTSLQFFKGFCVHRTATMFESAEWIISVANKLEKEFSKGKVPYYLTPHYLKYMKSPIEDIDTIAINDLSAYTTNDTLPPLPPQTNADYCSVVKKVKKENISPDNIGEIILCQIPGISSISAIAIMKKFDNFPHFMNELHNNKNCIANITTENNGKMRKISKTTIDNIYKYLVQPSDTSTL